MSILLTTSSIHFSCQLLIWFSSLRIGHVQKRRLSVQWITRLFVVRFDSPMWFFTACNSLSVLTINLFWVIETIVQTTGSFRCSFDAPFILKEKVQGHCRGLGSKVQANSALTENLHAGECLHLAAKNKTTRLVKVPILFVFSTVLRNSHK